jgi:hypothetical protein
MSIHDTFHALLRFGKRRMAAIHFSEYKRLIQEYGDARVQDVTAPQSPPTSGERETALPYAAFGLQVCRLHGGYVDRAICDAKDRDSAMAIALELNWLATRVAPRAPEPSEDKWLCAHCGHPVRGQADEDAEAPEGHITHAEKYGYSPDPWAVEIVELRAALRAEREAAAPGARSAEVEAIADEIERVQFAFDVNDSRRADLRKLAARVRALPARGTAEPSEAMPFNTGDLPEGNQNRAARSPAGDSE